MVEAGEKSHAINQIHHIVAGDDPRLKTELIGIEKFLRGKLFDPIIRMPDVRAPVLDATLFQTFRTSFPELDGDTPPVALFKAIRRERATGMLPSVIVSFESQDSLGGRSAEKGLIFTSDKPQQSEKKSTPRVAQLVKNGQRWLTIQMLRRSGISLGYNPGVTLISELPTEKVISPHNGRPMTLYPEEDVIALVTERKKKAIAESPRPLDSAFWEQTMYFADIFNLSYELTYKVLYKLNDVSMTKLSGKRYFRKAEANKTIVDYLAKRKIKGIYYKEGEACVTLYYLWKRFHMRYSKLRTELSSINSVPDEETGLTLYPLADALSLLQARKEADAGKEAKIISPEVGTEVSLITARILAEEYGVPLKSVQKLLKSSRHPKRNANRELQYPEEIARSRVQEVIGLPQIDDDTNQFVDEDGELYVMKEEARKRLGMHHRTIDKAIKGGVRQKQGKKDLRVYSGYSFSDLQVYDDGIPEAKKQQAH